MKENNSRREFLSQSGKMVTAAALFGPSVPLAHAGVAGISANLRVVVLRLI